MSQNQPTRAGSFSSFGSFYVENPGDLRRIVFIITPPSPFQVKSLSISSSFAPEKIGRSPVSRILFHPPSVDFSSHLSLRLLPGDPTGEPPFPCSVLHCERFTLPPRSPSARWALTPPFHPYHIKWRLFSVALSLPLRSHPLGGTPPYAARTFLMKRSCSGSFRTAKIIELDRPSLPTTIDKTCNKRILHPKPRKDSEKKEHGKYYKKREEQRPYHADGRT